MNHSPSQWELTQPNMDGLASMAIFDIIHSLIHCAAEVAGKFAGRVLEQRVAQHTWGLLCWLLFLEV